MLNQITLGGIDVLDDLNLSAEEAENLKLRARLMDALIDWIEEEGWNETEAAQQLGVQQPRISYLLRGRISKFTIDALINMCSHAGIKVDLVIDPLPA